MPLLLSGDLSDLIRDKQSKEQDSKIRYIKDRQLRRPPKKERRRHGGGDCRGKNAAGGAAGEDDSTAFYAMLHRMRYINRWSLMKNTEQENIMEHSYEVAIIAHALALVRRKYFAVGKICPAPEQVAVMALYHDLPEIMTGDIPTPVKYATKEMRASYRIVEQGAVQKLLAMLPAALQDEYRPLIFPSESDPVVQEMMQLVKAADRFSAYIKCLMSSRRNQELSGDVESKSD